jgi:DNA-binding beta-propeller fold protein YncE
VSQDGPALQATYTRPVIPCAKKDGSLVFIADDWGGNRVRMLSTVDNMVTTVIDGMASPWQMAFNAAEDKLFVVEREQSNRPILFYVLSQATNWVQREIYYDQPDSTGRYIASDMGAAGLTADDTYVYMLSKTRLIRIDQITKEVQCIGEKIMAQTWSYPVFNRKDRKLYIVSNEEARVYRVDPYHIPDPNPNPEGSDIPWITANDREHIAGMSPGSPIEGNGKSIRFGVLETPSNFDEDGNLYLPDTRNHVIWKLDPELNGTIIAGMAGSSGYKDGVPLEAQFKSPYGLSITLDGLIYVGDQGNKLIRCIAIQ